MKRIKIWNGHGSDTQVHDIASIMRSGGIGIMPTDSAYAIVGDALNKKAVDRICALKNINPAKQHLSVICDSISMASEYARIDDAGFVFLKEHTPGPFTVLFRTAGALPKAFRGRKAVGIRIPDLEFDRQLAKALGNPVITTTIEYDDEDYAVNPDLIAEAYSGKVDFVVEGDDGTTSLTTVLDASEGEFAVLREGLGSLD